MYRYIRKGGWPFSIRDHGWLTSDCTAEALKCSLLFSQMPSGLVGENMELNRLCDAVNVILSLQGSDGGFLVWEEERESRWLQMLNPTEFFGVPPIQHEYVEYTFSAIQALSMFRKLHPYHHRIQIEASIAKAVKYIEDHQNPDGSWDSSWGICYLYAIFFAVEGLVATGMNYGNSAVLRKACEFLLSKQLSCGGWGESHLSSQNKAEIEPTPIHRGIKVLINSQMDDGDFPQQEMVGGLMKNCGNNCAPFRNLFSIWTLGE